MGQFGINDRFAIKDKSQKRVQITGVKIRRGFAFPLKVKLVHYNAPFCLCSKFHFAQCTDLLKEEGQTCL